MLFDLQKSHADEGNGTDGWVAVFHGGQQTLLILTSPVQAFYSFFFSVASRCLHRNFCLLWMLVSRCRGEKYRVSCTEYVSGLRLDSYLCNAWVSVRGTPQSSCFRVPPFCSPALIYDSVVAQSSELPSGPGTGCGPTAARSLPPRLLA